MPTLSMLCLLMCASAAIPAADAVRAIIDTTGPEKAARKEAERQQRQKQEEQNEAMRALLRTYETLESLPSGTVGEGEEAVMQFIMLGLEAEKLAAANAEFKQDWADMWRQQPPREAAQPLECGWRHMRYSKKRISRLYDYSGDELERKAQGLCRFGKSATVFIWHMHDGNVGHVGMLLGSPNATFEDYRNTKFDAPDVGPHNEYTPGLGPHKAFSGCMNHPASWRSGNCFSYVSWWPAAPGVRSNPLTPVEASMHDFDSDQAAEGIEPEIIPIDDLTASELQSAFGYFESMRAKVDKTYNLLFENCAIGVGKVLAFGACQEDDCMHNATKVTKDSTGDLAMHLFEQSGCHGAYCMVCHNGEPGCGAASMFGAY